MIKRRRSGPAPRAAHQRRIEGFTLVEIMIALAVLAVAFVGLIASILYATRMNMVNRETTLAMRAAEQVVEIMESGTPFPDVFLRYNTAPGAHGTYANPYPAGQEGTFEVLPSGQIIFGSVAATQQTLFAPVSAGARVGRIQFPERVVGAAHLLSERDAQTLLALSGPGPQSNIDGDADFDELTVTSYIQLPVIVTLSFQSAGGGASRTVQFRKIMTAR